jgi:outer membrane immunogenic protein
MKTLTLALAGTALVGSLAVSAVANECSFSGFYLGAQLGAGTTNTETKATVGGVATKSRLAATGILGGLHVGYGKHFPNRFYVGLEAYGNLSNNKESNTAPQNVKLNTERKNAFGLALRPGFVFGNTLVYAKLGVESASFKYSVDTTAVGGTADSNSSRRTGFVPGLGVAFHATDHVILGLEATHTFYNSRTVNNVKFKSEATDFTARASYKW